MVGRKDVAGLLVPIEFSNELLRFANDIVDNANIVHVFLFWCEKHDTNDRQCGRTIPSSGAYMSVLWCLGPKDGGRRPPEARVAGYPVSHSW